MASIPDDLVGPLPRWVCMVCWHQPEVADCYTTPPFRSGPENDDEGKSSQEAERLVAYLLGPRRPDDWIHTGSWAMTIGLSY